MHIQTRLERYIVEEIMMADKNTHLDPDQSLLESGILDSLGLLRLIAFIESDLGLIVEDEEVVPNNFQTLKSITAFLQSKRETV